MRPVLLIALLLALGAPGRGEVRFLPPSNDRPLFKRDLLPLETDTIRSLSQQLTTLVSHGSEDDSAARKRADAQLVVLALQLDPVNREARRHLQRLERNEAPSLLPERELANALGRIEETVSWLLSPAAGSEGRLLGQLVIDPLRVLHPDHRLSRLAGPGGEAERWRGIVAPVTAFIRRQPPPDPPKPPVPEPETPAAINRSARFTLPSASLQTPLNVPRHDRFGGPGYRLVTVQLKLLAEETGELPLKMPGGNGNINSALVAHVREVLNRDGPALPAGQAYEVTLGGASYHESNQLDLGGPLALILHASLAGAPLRPDLTVMGAVSADGRFEISHHTWSALKSAFSGEEAKGRLLLPARATPQVRDLLVLEKYDFFVAREVYAVATLDEALAAARLDKEEDLAEASRLFADFQKVAAGRQLGELSSNSHVRSRMEKILSLAPNHLSASMILLHGSPQRPLKFGPSTLALELELCLKQLGQALVATELEELRTASLLRLEEQCLGQLRELRENTAPARLELIGRFEYTTRRLGRISRELEELRKIDPEDNDSLHRKALDDLRDAREKFAREYDGLREATDFLTR